MLAIAAGSRNRSLVWALEAGSPFIIDVRRSLSPDWKPGPARGAPVVRLGQRRAGPKNCCRTYTAIRGSVVDGGNGQSRIIAWSSPAAGVVAETVIDLAHQVSKDRWLARPGRVLAAGTVLFFRAVYQRCFSRVISGSALASGHPTSEVGMDVIEYWIQLRDSPGRIE